MVHLMPTKEQRQKEIEALINDLTALISKAKTEGKFWTIEQWLPLKKSLTAQLKKMG